MATNIELNTGLVEAFGELESLCNDIYGEKHGVTCYINDMENASPEKSRYIPDWNKNLKHLKDIRHKRNQLSHNDASFSDPLALQEDIDFAENMCKSIIWETDPLNCYKAYDQIAVKTAAKSSAQKSTVENTRKSSAQTKRSTKSKSMPEPLALPKREPRIAAKPKQSLKPAPSRRKELNDEEIFNALLKGFVAIAVIALVIILMTQK